MVYDGPTHDIPVENREPTPTTIIQEQGELRLAELQNGAQIILDLDNAVPLENRTTVQMHTGIDADMLCEVKFTTITHCSYLIGDVTAKG